jgi:hypothetical protein
VTKPQSGAWIERGAFARWAIGAAATSVALTFIGINAPASAAAPSASDEGCLACHGTSGLQKTLENGDTLSLQIEGDHFWQSVHSAAGCSGCHAEIHLDSHPPATNPIASKAAFSTAMVQICRTCHTQEFEQWDRSVHANLVREGNPGAPICTNCHAPHAMIQGAVESMETVPCKSCHAVIFTAYSTSVHGVLRNGGAAQAPLCFDCHGAHDVAVPSAGVGRKDVCLGCHTEAVDSHRSWLPEVDLHFGAVSCPVCHTPRAKRVVNLILFNSATQKEVPEPVGIPQFERLTGAATANKPGLDPTTLMTLLAALNSHDVEGKTSIRGRLEVRTGVEDHQLTFASKAISDCSICHRQGAAAFQSVEVSVAGPAGIPIRYDADKDVLSSVLSLDSVGGFYAIGGTRVTVLDVLFVLALLGGIGWSAFHMTARWIFRRFLNQMPDEQRKE